MHTRPRRDNPPRQAIARLSLLALGLLLSLALARPAGAEPVVEEYLHIEVDSSYDLGSVIPNSGGLHEPDEKLEVLVAANFAHGGLTISLTDLEHEASESTISRSRVSVRDFQTGTFLPLNQPRNVTGPANPGMFQLELEFRV
ncbi:MAG: hypothetical protein WDZ31_13685, partial [Phycisphaeraceae bacterium]